MLTFKWLIFVRKYFAFVKESYTLPLNDVAALKKAVDLTDFV